MDFESGSTAMTGAGITAGALLRHHLSLVHLYYVECYRDGSLLWTETFTNLVTTAGLNKYLDATLKTGLVAPAWYVGLVTGPGSGTTYAPGDTMAVHAGWSEDTTYSNATRPAFTPGAISAGSVDNSAAKAIFSINGTATIAGAFMVDDNTKGGAVGTLLGEGDFTAGDRFVQSGDTLNVTISASITAA